jgi:hypothetical protein
MSIFTPRPRLNLVSASLFIAAEAGWVFVQLLTAALLTTAMALFFLFDTNRLLIIIYGVMYLYTITIIGEAFLKALRQIWDMVGSIREELTDRQVNG